MTFRAFDECDPRNEPGRRPPSPHFLNRFFLCPELLVIKPLLRRSLAGIRCRARALGVLLLLVPGLTFAAAFQIEDVRIEGLQRVSAGTVFAALPFSLVW